MTCRQDTFEVGDKVTWYNDHYARFTGGRKRLGDGPFEIRSVHPVRCNLLPSAGHSQHVRIHLPEDAEGNYQFSGAFFKKVA